MIVYLSYQEKGKSYFITEGCVQGRDMHSRLLPAEGSGCAPKASLRTPEAGAPTHLNPLLSPLLGPRHFSFVGKPLSERQFSLSLRVPYMSHLLFYSSSYHRNTRPYKGIKF